MQKINLNTNKVNRPLYAFFVVLVFFPWVSFNVNTLDTQPWIFIFGSMFIWFFIKNQKDIFTLSLLLFLPIMSQFVAILFGSDFDLMLFIRGFISYAIFAYVYIIQKNNLNLYFDFYRYVFTINLLYLLVGVVQLITTPLFFDWIVTGRTSASRGVSSLSVEPTAFGLFLLVLSVIHLLSMEDHNRKKILSIVFLNAICILFVAQSSTASLYLLIGVVMLVFSKLNLMTKVSVSTLGASVFLYIIQYGSSRMAVILKAIFNGDFFNVFLLDQSVHDRIMATIYPFVSIYENLFIPGGFYLSSSLNRVDMSWVDSSLGYFHTGDKVMSLWGGVVAETGIIGFFVLFFAAIVLTRKIMALPKSMRGEYYLATTFLFLLGFSSISISLAPISFVVGLMISKINMGIKHV